VCVCVCVCVCVRERESEREREITKNRAQILYTWFEKIPLHFHFFILFYFIGSNDEKRLN